VASSIDGRSELDLQDGSPNARRAWIECGLKDPARGERQAALGYCRPVPVTFLRGGVIVAFGAISLHDVGSWSTS
jgi:hypothetical protein